MDGILKSVREFPLRFRKNAVEDEKQQEERRILQELDSVLLEMRIAEQQFNETGDSDLTESSIYALTALRARYRYWYRKAVTAGISAGLFRKEQGRKGYAVVENFLDSIP